MDGIGINPALFESTCRAVIGASFLQKEALVPPGAPPGGDPSQAGAPPAPPMDPSMGGAVPPPVDPSQGAAPPMDPAAMGGMPPVAPPAPAAAAPAAGVKAKIDPAEIRALMYRLNVLFLSMFNQMGLTIPSDAVLGPPPPGLAPPSADPALQPQQQQAQAPADPAANSAIQPIQPMGAAIPQGAPATAAADPSKSASDELVASVGRPAAGSPVASLLAPAKSDVAGLASLMRSLNAKAKP